MPTTDEPDPDADLYDGTDIEPGHRGVLDRHATDTQKTARAYVHEKACREFDHFVVTKEREGQWRCGKPGGFAYSFRVLTCPGKVIFTGDVGDLILHTSMADPVEWLKSTLSQPWDELDYLCRKAPREFQEKTWMAGEALDELRTWLKDEIADAPDAEEWPEKHAKAVADAKAVVHEILEEMSWADEEDAQKKWWDAWTRHTECDPCDGVPDPTFWSSKMLWVYEGLKWFVLQLGPEDK